MALSQASTTSSVCMIPPDLVEDQDAEFYSEIVEVNDLYFGNFDVEDTEVKSDHNHDTDDNDSESDSDCDNANISHNLDNDGDLKEADKSEYDLLSQFKKQTCGCNRLYGSPCSANVDWESVIEYRRHCQEMTNDELDVAIKFQLFHHRKNDSVTDKKKHKSKERERSRQEYFFSGKRVCRVTFAFAHGVNRKKVDAIAHSLDNEGLGQAECSNQTRMHYSFDYAQQVHYPHYAQQVGPLFFKTPRKSQCFGVCAEGSGSQIFYLVDEAEYTGKGANTVASMLHHHFLNKGYGEKDVNLHMDNCSGQNKNNTVIGYGLWRVMTARHDSMQFSLMEAGHTKFHPDWHFGLWKVKWRMSTVETLEEVAESVTKSSRNGHNIPQLVGDAERPVIIYDWSKYLKEYFKPIPHLKTYHHFRVSRHNPGIVFVKEYANSPEVEINVLRNQNCRFPHLDPELPAVIPPKGLDPARQWYLYEEVAPYCNNKDSCKKPDVTKPILKAEQSEEYDKKRKCSHCKSCGHTKSRGGIITCPKLL
ncbi:hypothetical protein KUTeg_018791 [Tegillarca granosa]|uniref:DUF7869 domain-containing protein n=1 Tax=Tegillarca granosa TaxID=220873 RepID=A0ABQ9EEA4_TEGGR|nr:hypothetical protein KUTeg_018791 [Tegillarca granosa]